MRTYIICENNENDNATFKCAHCGRNIFHMQLVNKKVCPRCQRKFKNKIVIRRK